MKNPLRNRACGFDNVSLRCRSPSKLACLVEINEEGVSVCVGVRVWADTTHSPTHPVIASEVTQRKQKWSLKEVDNGPSKPPAPFSCAN